LFWSTASGAIVAPRCSCRTFPTSAARKGRISHDSVNRYWAVGGSARRRIGQLRLRCHCVRRSSLGLRSRSTWRPGRSIGARRGRSRPGSLSPIKSDPLRPCWIPTRPVRRIGSSCPPDRAALRAWTPPSRHFLAQ
jgi:hypothetical protein